MKIILFKHQNIIENKLKVFCKQKNVKKYVDFIRKY